MLTIALTGGIATGKSHVLARCATLGMPTIDADRLAHEVVRRHTPAWTDLRTRFGDGVFAPDGELDRPRLAAQVFADPAARRDLEAIIHPRVYQAIREWLDALAASDTHAAAMADIPLLCETGHHRDFDWVVVVACSPEQQVRRIVARDGLTEADARQRLAAQWPIADKVALADAVIWTEGSLADTDEQTDRLFAELGR